MLKLSVKELKIALEMIKLDLGPTYLRHLKLIPMKIHDQLAVPHVCRYDNDSTNNTQE